MKTRDSSHLRPGEPRCEHCQGSGKDPRAPFNCPVCRGFGSAPPDLNSPLAAAGTICAACGNPGTGSDPVLLAAGDVRVHRSHAIEQQAAYRAALRNLEGAR